MGRIFDRKAAPKLIASGIANKILQEFLDWVAQMHELGRTLKEEPTDHLTLKQCQFVVAYRLDGDKPTDIRISLFYQIKGVDYSKGGRYTWKLGEFELSVGVAGDGQDAGLEVTQNEYNFIKALAEEDSEQCV